jgi:hypothetical protein
MINTLALILPIANTQYDAEGSEVYLLVMVDYDCFYVALIKFCSSP